MSEPGLRVQARVDLAAIRRNCELLVRAAPRSELCAVVKADAYGHGALAVARAARDGGARRLAVVDGVEAEQLRAGGVDGPLLVMGALTEDGLRRALAAHAEVVVWDVRGLDAVRALGGGTVHVKLDSGMGRLGTRDAPTATATVRAALDAPEIELAGLMTHFATADERDDGGFMDRQLAAFNEWAAPIKSEHPALILHAANSAAVLRDDATHLDMVRCGIAVYGIDPFGVDGRAAGLEPALELTSYVAQVKACRAGESAGYGRRFTAERDTNIAVVPVGYGDGWRRGLTNNGTVSIAGRPCPIAGTISMDSFTVDVGPDAGEELVGATVALIGAGGPTAEEIAARLGTIGYEVTCALTARVPRIHYGEPE
ncbi:MAG TPA: alanine racemase [Solirubrobacteraceae bacterium]|nr:alanine racemase [Solirubrobacteraceae bacterium]